jgi:beta-N-acetylhexosaminidase
VEEAAGRVSALSDRLRAADAGEPVPFDAAEIVRRAIQGAPTPPASALSVVDARRRSTLAVDSAAAYVAAALSGDDHRVRLDVARASAEERDAALDAAVSAAGTTVILVDRPDSDPGQRDLVERAARRDPGAVVVNVGLVVRSPLPLPVVEVGAASRIGALMARERLLGRVG